MSEISMTSSKPYLLRAIYEWIIDNGCTPYIDVNTTLPGVVVPPQYKQQGRIVLNIAPRATNKFIMNNEVLEFEARIGGAVARMIIPINAVTSIYARENGQGMVFASEQPPETNLSADTTDSDFANLQSTTKKTKDSGATKNKPKFTVIKGDT